MSYAPDDHQARCLEGETVELVLERGQALEELDRGCGTAACDDRDDTDRVGEPHLTGWDREEERV